MDRHSRTVSMKNKTMSASSGLYAITDCENLTCDELIKKSEDILNAGVSLFQYRNKDTNQQKKKELAQELLSLCQQYNTPSPTILMSTIF